MKQIGIWLDKQEANVVVLNNGKESMFTIPSELDFFNPKGGARSKTKWGPQDVVQDSKYLEREKHQLKSILIRLPKRFPMPMNLPFLALPKPLISLPMP